MSNVTIQPSNADTSLFMNAPTTNYGTNTKIYVLGYYAAGNNKISSILKFDFSAVVPAGATITLATLSLYCLQSVASRTITVYRLLRTDWVETGATWNVYKTGSNWGTAGALGSGVDFTPTDAASATSVAADGWLNEIVTAQVQTALDSVGGVAHFFVADAAASSGGVSNNYSSNNDATTTLRPKLYIEYTLPFPKVNIGGVWKQGTAMWVNIGGVWKEVTSVKTNIGGVWK